VLGVGLLGLGVTSAGAAPANAKTALSGTFSACTNGQSGTFVVNSGNSHAAQTWNAAHLTFASGGTGIFVPTAVNLTFTQGGQSQTQNVKKGSAKGTVTCTIAASGPGFSLAGTVTGKMVRNGG
jgi:hypothetical protein